jgi:uncharacterized protein YjiS (DUF1127 family)
MSTICNAPATPRGIAGQRARKLVATLDRWLAAYMAWRLEQAAIAALSAMSDRDLKDMGLHRSGIPAAVRGQGDAAGRRALPTSTCHSYRSIERKRTPLRKIASHLNYGLER